MTDKVISRQLIEDFLSSYPGDAANKISSMSLSDQLSLAKSLSSETLANIIHYLETSTATQLISKLPEDRRQKVLEKIDPRDVAKVFHHLDEDIKTSFLEKTSPTIKKEIEGLMSYTSDKAGYYMDPKVFSFSPKTEVRDVLKKIRNRKTRRVFNIYVVDVENHLIGTVSLENLALASDEEPIGGLMNGNPIGVRDYALREEAIETFEKSRLGSIPVVDYDGRLLGVIRQAALIEAVEREALSDLQKLVGAGSEERALSKVFFAVKKRLPWLHINLATAFLAAAVVGIFEGTIAKFTALAVLLPVVAGQSGNSGAQALAVTLRGLALREVRVNQWIRISLKELRVGLLNGIAVAFTTGVGVYFWSRSLGLSLVIGLAMIISMMAAGLAGAVIPLTLTSLKQDPAQSSSIFLTTVTDIVGFFSFLGLATVFSRYL